MKSEDIYKKIVESTCQGIWVIDKNKNTVMINRSMASMLGYSEAEASGESILNYISPSDRNKVIDHVALEKKGKKGFLEVNFVKKDRSLLPVSISTCPLFDKNGDYEGGIGMVTDKSETKQLSKNLQMKEETLNLLFNNNPNAMWIYEQGSFRFLEVNHAAEEMYGYSRDEFLRMKITDIRPKEDIPLLFEMLKNPAILRPSYNVKHKTKDGAIIFVDIVSHDITFNNKKATLISASNATPRKKILDALEKSEEKYRILFESSSTGIAYCSPDSTLLLINEIGAKYFGFTPAQMQGKSIFDFISNEKENDIREALQEAISTRKYVEREDYAKNDKSGTCFLSKYQPLFDGNDDIYGLQITFEDITERKRSEKILRESETRFRHLFEDISQIPVQGYDSQHRVLFWNKASEIVYGYTKDEAMGKKLEDLIIPKHLKNDVYNSIEDFYKKDIHIPSGEIGLKRKDGSIVSMFSSHVMIQNYNGNKEMYCVDIDMSERIEAERQIALQARMLNAVGESVIVTDKNGKIIYVNDAAQKLYGWVKEEMLSKNITCLISQNQVKEQAEEFLKYSKLGKTWSGEFFAQKKDGTIFPVYGTNSPLYNSCNELMGIIGVSFDISDLKHKERELKAAKDKAEEMHKIKSAFLTNMSHELRTPLMGILGFSEILNDELSDDMHKSITSSILFSGKRLLTTLNAILDLSKIEANMMEVIYSEFMVVSEIQTVLRVFEILAAKKNIDLCLDFQEDDFDVELDKNLFIQILENLVHNALKFTETGSVTISVRKDIGSFSVKVIDTGIGIPKDSLDVIFNEFRQVSEGYGRSFDGSGIGLTLTKRFVQLLNGIIYVESKVNQGSTFTVSLPIKLERKRKPKFPVY